MPSTLSKVLEFGHLRLLRCSHPPLWVSLIHSKFLVQKIHESCYRWNTCPTLPLSLTNFWAQQYLSLAFWPYSTREIWERRLAWPLLLFSYSWWALVLVLECRQVIYLRWDFILSLSTRVNLVGFALNPAHDLGPRIFMAMAGYGKQVFIYRRWVNCVRIWNSSVLIRIRKAITGCGVPC